MQFWHILKLRILSQWILVTKYRLYRLPLHILRCSMLFLSPFERGSYMVWEINMGVCPRLKFDDFMFINSLGYDFHIYGAFEFLCNSIANL